MQFIFKLGFFLFNHCESSSRIQSYKPVDLNLLGGLFTVEARFFVSFNVALSIFERKALLGAWFLSFPTLSLFSLSPPFSLLSLSPPNFIFNFNPSLLGFTIGTFSIVLSLSAELSSDVVRFCLDFSFSFSFRLSLSVSLFL